MSEVIVEADPSVFPEGYTDKLSRVEVVEQKNGEVIYGVIEFGEGEDKIERRLQLDLNRAWGYDPKDRERYNEDRVTWTVDQLTRQAFDLTKRNSELESRIAELEAKLTATSSNIRQTPKTLEYGELEDNGTKKAIGMWHNGPSDQEIIDTFGELEIPGIDEKQKKIKVRTSEEIDGKIVTQIKSRIVPESEVELFPQETIKNHPELQPKANTTKIVDDTEPPISGENDNSPPSSTETRREREMETKEKKRSLGGLLVLGALAAGAALFAGGFLAGRGTEDGPSKSPKEQIESSEPWSQNHGSGNSLASGHHTAFYNSDPTHRLTGVELPKNLNLKFIKNGRQIVDSNGKVIVSRVEWDREGDLSRDTRIVLKANNYKMVSGKLGDRHKTIVL